MRAYLTFEGAKTFFRVLASGDIYSKLKFMPVLDLNKLDSALVEWRSPLSAIAERSDRAGLRAEQLGKPETLTSLLLVALII